jgi:hypothetical protein
MMPLPGVTKAAADQAWRRTTEWFNECLREHKSAKERRKHMKKGHRVKGKDGFFPFAPSFLCFLRSFCAFCVPFLQPSIVHASYSSSKRLNATSRVCVSSGGEVI